MSDENESQGSAEDQDYNLKRGKHMEDIGDQHFKINEFKKAAQMYKDAFNNYKKGADKTAALRAKEKFDNCKKILDQSEKSE